MIFIKIEPHRLSLVVTTGSGEILEEVQAENGPEEFEQHAATVLKDAIRAVTQG